MVKRELKALVEKGQPLETIISWDNDPQYGSVGRGWIDISFTLGQYRTIKTERGSVRYFTQLSTAAKFLSDCGVTDWRFTNDVML